MNVRNRLASSLQQRNDEEPNVEFIEKDSKRKRVEKVIMKVGKTHFE